MRLIATNEFFYNRSARGSPRDREVEPRGRSVFQYSLCFSFVGEFLRFDAPDKSQDHRRPEVDDHLFVRFFAGGARSCMFPVSNSKQVGEQGFENGNHFSSEKPFSP